MATCKQSRLARRRLIRAGDRVDAGFTLAEITVSMAVTAVVMAMATSGMVQMYRFGARSDILSTNMTQLDIAFQQLDRSVRYATAISQPNTTATASGGWYVEWSSVTSATTACSQLRLDGAGHLQRRSEAAGGQISGWATAASFLTSTQPFSLQPASTSGYPHERLTVDVTVQSAVNSSQQAARRSTFSFTALNTSMMTSSSGVCTDMDRP